MTLFARGEFGFIDGLRRRAGSDRLLRLGIGDDCSAREMPPGELLLTTTDLLLEDVHFRRAWTDPQSLGLKSVAVNASDIAAMGGTPDHLFLGLGLPDDLAEEDAQGLLQGLFDGLARYGLTLAGGDTCRSRTGLMIAVTLHGRVPTAELVQRSGALPGDRLWVSGFLGGSAGALRCLQQGMALPPALRERHLRPVARVALGRELSRRRLVHAMIDLSDGLLADLGHLLRASGAGAELDLARLPLPPALVERFPLTECHELALCGGEDYELLMAVPAENELLLTATAAALQVPLSCIGTVTDRQGCITANAAGGMTETLVVRGFDHFATTRDVPSRRFCVRQDD